MSLQLEVLLRPPVEMYSALVAFSAATLTITAPSVLMMPPTVAYASAALMSALGGLRAYQAYCVLRYQRRLKRLPRFVMDNEEIPCTPTSLYLGRGFRWTQRHVQRLKDSKDPRAQRYLKTGLLFGWARRREREAPESLLARITSIDAWWNPLRPLPAVGGDPVIHAVEPEEQDMHLSFADRQGHTLVIGTTGCGKTQFLIILMWQDIMRPNACTIILDPKGDGALLEAAYQASVAAGKEDRFRVFHLGYPELSARYNPIGSFSRITEIAGRVSAQLPGEGDSAAFKQFSWMAINVVARALVVIGVRPTYDQLLGYVQDPEPLFVRYVEASLKENATDPDWSADINALERAIVQRIKRNPRSQRFSSPRTEALMMYVQTKEMSDPVLFGLIQTLRYERTYYSKITASAIPLLQKLTTGKVGALLSPAYMDMDDPRPIIDWPTVIRENAVVVVGLDALGDAELAEAVGSAMFSDLVSTASLIYRHGAAAGEQGSDPTSVPRIYIHADEFSQMIGKNFLPLANQARGAGVVLTAYSQSRSDIEMGMGSKAGAGVVESNFNNTIMFRVKSRDTAELLTDQLPEVEVNAVMTVSGVTDSSRPDSETDFTSSTQDRVSKTSVPLLDPATIVSLPKGQAFCLLSGSQLWKARFPLPKTTRSDVPETLKKLIQRMKHDYYSAEGWWIRG